MMRFQLGMLWDATKRLVKIRFSFPNGLQLRVETLDYLQQSGREESLLESTPNEDTTSLVTAYAILSKE